MINRLSDRRNAHRHSIFLLIVFLIATVSACNIKNAPVNFERRVVHSDPSFAPLSPQESMSRVQLPPGYRMELVASEPMVPEPVAIAWDGKGRMYVAEMNII